jgi:hypothetical protein
MAGSARPTNIDSTEFLEMLEDKYWYAYEKFSRAIYTLATGAGDVRSRLHDVFFDPLLVIQPKHLPEDLREDFLWIKKKITKYKEKWPGQLEELRGYEKKDPLFKEKLPYLYPNPIKATLSRIRRNTGVEIAKRIFKIYDSLDSRVRD